MVCFPVLSAINNLTSHILNALQGEIDDMKTLNRFLGPFLIVALIMANIVGFSGEALAQGKTYKIAVVVHGSQTDPFWKPVKRGVNDAAALYPDL
jgi:ABC-type sugar transport system substrate-binding protein